MTCKDCIHCDVCEAWYKKVAKNGLAKGPWDDRACTDRFQDKSTIAIETIEKIEKILETNNNPFFIVKNIYELKKELIRGGKQ